MKTPKERRVARLTNRIRRTKARLRACDEARADEGRMQTLRGLARLCDGPGRDFHDVVDDVAEHLDKLIEPRSLLWEWVSDRGIDIVAHAAVAIWRDTEGRLRRRLERDRRTLARLEAA